eukprot:92583-Rhodomonas_salina.1
MATEMRLMCVSCTIAAGIKRQAPRSDVGAVSICSRHSTRTRSPVIALSQRCLVKTPILALAIEDGEIGGCGPQYWLGA